MTTTVKLPDPLEQSLRERCALESRSISEVMRDALVMYLASSPKGQASAHDLGLGLFGRDYGSAVRPDLAGNRKYHAAAVWNEIAMQKTPAGESPAP